MRLINDKCVYIDNVIYKRICHVVYVEEYICLILLVLIVIVISLNADN